MRLLSWLLVLPIRFYQCCISPLLGPSCRFTPTCSEYARQAFLKRGFFVGLILSIGRIFRCQPFSVGGYDPVPERGLRNPKMRPMTKYYYPELYDLEREESAQ